MLTGFDPKQTQNLRARLDEWEKRLQSLIGEGGLLLGELGFIEKDLHEIGELLTNTSFLLLRQQKNYTLDKALTYIRDQCPLTYALYLVLEGIYHYTSEEQYWHGPMERLGLQNSYTSDCGLLFLEILARYNLPTFAHSSGHTYIKRILLHGGIPNEFLPNLFEFLWKIEIKPHRIAPDTELLLQLWRKEPDEHLTYLPRSVQRFLRYGEVVAVDFVERCLDLFYTDSLDEALALVDLPKRVIKAYWRWREDKGIQTRHSDRHIRLQKPILTLAPYATGIALYLPDQQLPSQDAPRQLTWHLQMGDLTSQSISTTQQRIEGGYQYAAVPVTAVPPASQYTIHLEADGEPLQTWTLPGFNDPPILFFAPYDDYEGDALADQERFRSSEERWLLYPQDWRWQEQGQSRKIRDLPRLPGNWGSYKLEVWRLEPGEMVFQEGNGRSHSFTIAPEKSRQKPHLTEGGRLPLPTAAKDFPLYVGHPPHLIIYTQDPHRWHLTLRASGDSQPDCHYHYRLAELSPMQQDGFFQLDLASPKLLGESPIGKFEIVVRGPLGQSDSLGLRVIPSLTIEGLDQIYLETANSPAQFKFTSDMVTEIRQNPPQIGVNLQLISSTNDDQRCYVVQAQPDIQQLMLQLRHQIGVVIPLTIPINRLRWGLHHEQAEEMVVGQTQPSTIYPGSLLNMNAALWIDVPIVKDCPLYVGWQLVREHEEILDFVRPGEKPVPRRWEIPLGDLTAVWRERQETLCWQLVIMLPDQREPLIIPAFYLLPTLDFGDLAYDWEADGEQVHLTLLWEKSQPGSYHLQLWPLDRPWIKEPISLRLPETAVSLAEWKLFGSQLPAEAYLAELLVYNPWQSTQPQRPQPDHRKTLLIKPDGLGRYYEEIAQLRDQGQANIEQLLALLAHQFYNNQKHELFQTNKAIADQREMLSLTWLVRWLELTASLDKTAYMLAQIRAFDQTIIERLAQESLPDDELDRYFRHLPKTFSEKLWAWVLKSGLRFARSRCLAELCRLPPNTPAQEEAFQMALGALLADVADGSLLLNEAVLLLAPNAQAAANHLASDGSRDAQELLVGLTHRANLKPNWIAPGMLLDSDLGLIQADKLRSRTTNQPRFCTPLKADCYVEGKLLLSSTAVAIRLDLHNSLLKFTNVEPYQCRHCQQLFGNAADYTQHHEAVHTGENQSRRRLKRDERVAWIRPQLTQTKEEKEH